MPQKIYIYILSFTAHSKKYVAACKYILSFKKKIKQVKEIMQNTFNFVFNKNGYYDADKV